MTGPEADALDRIECELSQIVAVLRLMGCGAEKDEASPASLYGVADYLQRIAQDVDRMTDHVTRN